MKSQVFRLNYPINIYTFETVTLFVLFIVVDVHLYFLLLLLLLLLFFKVVIMLIERLKTIIESLVFFSLLDHGGVK